MAVVQCDLRLKPNFGIAAASRDMQMCRLAWVPFVRIEVKTETFVTKDNGQVSLRRPPGSTQLHPVVEPHVSHFRHVPFRTMVKFEHSGQASPT